MSVEERPKRVGASDTHCYCGAEWVVQPGVRLMVPLSEPVTIKRGYYCQRCDQIPKAHIG